MSTADIISSISAVIALASLVISIVFSRKAKTATDEAGKSAKDAIRTAELANNEAKRANEIAMGVAETSLRAAITSARVRYQDISAECEELSEGREAQAIPPEVVNKLRPKLIRLHSAKEDFINAYEDACGKYRDGKIDQTRFYKVYWREIQSLVESGKYTDILKTESSSPYQAIWKVYREWTDKEANPALKP